VKTLTGNVNGKGIESFSEGFKIAVVEEISVLEYGCSADIPPPFSPSSIPIFLFALFTAFADFSNFFRDRISK
jgi:hypothetical protein